MKLKNLNIFCKKNCLQAFNFLSEFKKLGSKIYILLLVSHIDCTNDDDVLDKLYLTVYSVFSPKIVIRFNIITLCHRWFHIWILG